MVRKTIYLALCGLAALSLLAAGCSDDDDNGPSCGNGICETTEDATSCFEDCGCGNGILNDGEECDGELLDEETCESQGFESGTLRCSDTCTFDVLQCVGGCGNMLQENQEECDGTDLAEQTCQSQGFDGGDLACAANCTFDVTGCCESTCDTENASRCATNTVIETCTAGAGGCLAWTTGEDCANSSMVCDDTSGTAVCTSGCTDNCPNENDLRCENNAVEICTMVGQCLDWQVQQECNTDVCLVVANVPQCVTSGSGDTCADPIVVTTFPANFAGTDISADFADDITLTSTANPGCGTANGVDAVFAVPLEAGQSLHLVEASGDLDAVIRVVDVCDETSAVCLLSSDSPEDVVFTAHTDGVYFVILEAYYTTDTSAYDFTLDILPSESDCGDGTDNDGDGLTDCEDPDCFGQGACTTESDCGDGWDNDGDGQTDCNDTDCAGFPPCVGDECSNPMAVTAFPFVLSGTDITADFTNTIDFDPLTGCGYASGVEGIFIVSLQAGERIRVYETGGLDSVLRVLDACNETTAQCLADLDSNETAGILFTAPGTADYYVVLEAYSASPYSLDYSFHIDLVPDTETSCGDGIDEDMDGSTDCSDQDCFGVPPCTTESLCNDGLDNDADGQTDCADTDCANVPPCVADDCAHAMVINSFPFTMSGTDISADFTDTIDFEPLTGCDTAHGAEAIFLVSLQAGESIRVYETGGLDSVLRVLDACNETTAQCLADADLGSDESAGILFTAPSTADYYVVFEAYSASPYTRDYSFHVDLVPTNETNCGDGIDEDLDGLTDCLDPDCAGSCTEILNEGFDTWPPAGWTIQDGSADGNTWVQCDSSCSAVLNNAVGSFVMADSDAAGSSVDMEEGLVTPSLNCSGYSSVQLYFTQYYRDYSSGDSAAVEVSVDGGTNWTPVEVYTASTTNGQQVILDLSAQAAGQADVMIRFLYIANYDYYWYIDSVHVFGL